VPFYPPQHLVIVASPRPIRDYVKVVNGPGWYPGESVEVGGWIRMSGWRMRWVWVPPGANEGSALAGHEVLIWTTGGHTYAVGFHDTTTRAGARAMDLELVRHLRLVAPSRRAQGRPLCADAPESPTRSFVRR
jgi:hypothetical protein